MTKRRFSISHMSLAALFLSLAPLGEALALPFVTGSGNTNGYTVAGYMKAVNATLGSGEFTVVVHYDTPLSTTAAIICNYRVFDRISVVRRIVNFHSLGSCRRLLTNGSVSTFVSDNQFRITDFGQPGAGHDRVAVTLVSGSGITVPEAVLVDGNFIVSP